jgi:hypothetical protein
MHDQQSYEHFDSECCREKTREEADDQTSRNITT